MPRKFYFNILRKLPNTFSIGVENQIIQNNFSFLIFDRLSI